MADSRERKADSRERKADSRERKADSRKRKADSRERKADSRERKADSRERKADSRERKPTASVIAPLFDVLRPVLNSFILYLFINDLKFVLNLKHGRKGSTKINCATFFFRFSDIFVTDSTKYFVYQIIKILKNVHFFASADFIYLKSEKIFAKATVFPKSRLFL
jgi:hypothetical protein